LKTPFSPSGVFVLLLLAGIAASAMDVPSPLPDRRPGAPLVCLAHASAMGFDAEMLLPQRIVSLR